MGKRLETALKIKPYLQKGAQVLDGNEALSVKTIYSKWDDLVVLGSVNYDESGYKFTHDGDLYKCVNANPTFQSDWVPGIGTSAMYIRIDETHSGTIDDPIPAARGMEYTYFLYYLDPEDNNVYLCQFGDTNTTGTVTLAYLPHEVPTYFKMAEV